MICPKCRSENSDTAAECSVCLYKFRFGHAYNDPAHMMHIDSPPARRRLMFVILIGLAALLLGLIIALSFIRR